MPVAAFDTGQVAWPLEVRPASGAEDYLTFSGDIERPDAGEIVFADAEGHAHARRWAHRQSSRSALQAGTRAVLVVAEALHENAAASIDALMTQLEHDLRGSSVSVVARAVLTARQPVFAPRGR